MYHLSTAQSNFSYQWINHIFGIPKCPLPSWNTSRTWHSIFVCHFVRTSSHRSKWKSPTLSQTSQVSRPRNGNLLTARRFFRRFPGQEIWTKESLFWMVSWWAVRVVAKGRRKSSACFVRLCFLEKDSHKSLMIYISATFSSNYDAMTRSFINSGKAGDMRNLKGLKKLLSKSSGFFSELGKKSFSFNWLPPSTFPPSPLLIPVTVKPLAPTWGITLPIVESCPLRCHGRWRTLSTFLAQFGPECKK